MSYDKPSYLGNIYRSHFGFGQQAKLQPEIKTKIENKIEGESWTTIT